MKNFERALKEIDQFCNQTKIEYTIIGGLALIAHGINRSTEDIDINLLTKLENLEETGKNILSMFDSVCPDPISFFQTKFVLPVIHRISGIGIDFIAGLTGFDEQAIRRSVKKEFYSLQLPFITIEDLVIYKLFARMKKDLLDLEEIAKIHKDKLDKTYLDTVLDEFSKLERNNMLANYQNSFL